MSQESPHTSEVATLAGGCFWCLEAVYDQLKGVEHVESGYTGGQVINPSYRQVCNGDTGHAEAVQITFDPRVISFKDLLDIFFTIHDPTTLNRQGADMGTQYRSAIFYRSPEQRRLPSRRSRP
jgi:peptide-methionine (S)-S-oxide reductase